MSSMAPSSSRSSESSHRRVESSSSMASSPHSVHANPKHLVASSWNVIEQPPPPSLREILGAYRARGDGDRDMLLAMLSAKSAEDQRIASVANLHRSLLEYQNVPQPSSPYSYPQHVYPYHQPPEYDVHLPPVRSHQPESTYHATAASRSRARPYSSPDSPGADASSQVSAGSRRKRARASPSAERASPAYSAPPSRAPSSPCSDPSRSPASRGSMAIDSLLLDPPSVRTHMPQSHARGLPQHLPVSSPIAAV